MIKAKELRLVLLVAAFALTISACDMIVIFNITQEVNDKMDESIACIKNGIIPQIESTLLSFFALHKPQTKMVTKRI